MFRPYVTIMLFVLLSGCSLGPAFVAGEPEGGVAAPRDAYCVSVARQRAQDAAYNGYGDDMQKRIYARSYADCVVGKEESAR